jgi:oxygen-independent coproporphyrinogen-3 oxidase
MGTGSTQELASLPEAPAGTPIYIHLPFCAAKCHYCDFYSVPAEGQNVSGTVDAIAAEIRRRAPKAPRTVFLGGGTPSLLSVEQLTLILSTLQEVSGFRESAVEVTAECNPESLDLEKARALLELGVNRVSIGFQSLRESTLELFGRVHSSEQSFRAYEAARGAGFRNVNVDLIYANPGQSIQDWQQDLERVLALGPDHISAYNLTFEEDTLFRRWLEQGKLRPHADEVELDFFWLTRERLSRARLEPYEISNFSLSGYHCRHNVNYWHNGPYVGIGPSAVGKVGSRRGGNLRHLGQYRARMRDGRSALDWHEALPAWARLGETWWLGLRLSEGLRAEDAWTRANLEGWDAARDPALDTARWAESHGWMEQVDGRWRLARKGWPVADAVAREFLKLATTDRPPPTDRVG